MVRRTTRVSPSSSSLANLVSETQIVTVWCWWIRPPSAPGQVAAARKQFQDRPTVPTPTTRPAPLPRMALGPSPGQSHARTPRGRSARRTTAAATLTGRSTIGPATATGNRAGTLRNDCQAFRPRRVVGAAATESVGRPAQLWHAQRRRGLRPAGAVSDPVPAGTAKTVLNADAPRRRDHDTRHNVPPASDGESQ